MTAPLRHHHSNPLTSLPISPLSIPLHLHLIAQLEALSGRPILCLLRSLHESQLESLVPPPHLHPLEAQPGVPLRPLPFPQRNFRHTPPLSNWRQYRKLTLLVSTLRGSQRLVLTLLRIKGTSHLPTSPLKNWSKIIFNVPMTTFSSKTFDHPTTGVSHSLKTGIPLALQPTANSFCLTPDLFSALEIPRTLTEMIQTTPPPTSI
mmetsp:Transcript_23697/g.49660  ORF Transcript_23697/g.49660 Transcript_23697/m.49660 type:complete len:205 (-) Transcript_23697:360-974(-)